jgi:hypothetical protein
LGLHEALNKPIALAVLVWNGDESVDEVYEVPHEENESGNWLKILQFDAFSS